MPYVSGTYNDASEAVHLDERAHWELVGELRFPCDGAKSYRAMSKPVDGSNKSRCCMHAFEFDLNTYSLKTKLTGICYVRWMDNRLLYPSK